MKLEGKSKEYKHRKEEISTQGNRDKKASPKYMVG